MPISDEQKQDAIQPDFQRDVVCKTSNEERSSIGFIMPTTRRSAKSYRRCKRRTGETFDRTINITCHVADAFPTGLGD